MAKTILAAFVCAITVWHAHAQGDATPKRPNVLYVIADMDRANSLGCYGDANAKTPALDKFASQGLRLDAAISQTPVCCPYRASLMSGQLAHHNGTLSNGCKFKPTVKCLGETFKEAGYQMGYVGKWHLGRADQESDPTYGFPPPGSEYGIYHFSRNPSPTTDRALKFIREKSKAAAPWMLVVSWIWPHAPYNPPEELSKDFGKVTLAPNVPPGRARKFAEQSLPGYYGMIEGVDRQFARLLAALEESGAASNTIVVFTSDHGDMIGSQGLKAKRWPYEESARVPFLIRYPAGIPSGRALADPFGSTDIYPTLAALARIKAPSNLDGADFSALFTGSSSVAPRDYAYLEMPYAYVGWPGWKALRTKDHMYARTVDGPWLLYDIANDPWETNNLVTSKPEEVKKYEAKLAETISKYGDSWSFKTDTGDVNSWLPGGPKQQSQNLGTPYRGQQQPTAAQLTARGKKGKKKKSADDDD